MYKTSFSKAYSDPNMTMSFDRMKSKINNKHQDKF